LVDESAQVGQHVGTDDAIAATGRTSTAWHDLSYCLRHRCALRIGHAACAEARGQSLQQYLAAELTRLTGTPPLEEVLDRIAGRRGGRVGLSQAMEDLDADRAGLRSWWMRPCWRNAIGDDEADGAAARGAIRQRRGVNAPDLVAVLRKAVVGRHTAGAAVRLRGA
jgi:hypothetical protein